MQSQERRKMFSLGIFILLGSIGFFAVTLFSSRTTFSGNQEFRVAFTDIGGINRGASVYFAGKAVGRVSAIHDIVNQNIVDASGKLYVYELRLKVAEDVHVCRGDSFVITSPKIIGDRVIHIIPKVPDRREENFISCDELSFGFNRDPIKQLGEVMFSIQEKIEGISEEISQFSQMVQGSIENVSEEVSSLSASLKSVSESVNSAMLADKIADAVESVKKNSDILSDYLAYPNLNKLGKILDNIEEVSGDIRNYGLFYRYNKLWKVEDKKRRELVDRTANNGCRLER